MVSRPDVAIVLNRPSFDKYDPLVKDRDKSFEINEERAKYWLSVGAKASDTVRSMLKRRGIQSARG